MGFLDSLLSTGAQVTGIEKSRQALLDAGSAAQTGAAQVGGTAAGMAQFKPFTVTGGTGSLTTTPEGGFGMQLSPQQQAIQNNMFGAAGNLSAQIGQPANPMYGQMANQAYGQSQGFLGQVGQIDPRMQAQRNALGGMFGQQAGQYGQPTGLEGITQQALMGGQQGLQSLSAPQDIEALRSQYAGLAGQSAAGLGSTNQVGRQQDIYNQLRSMQTPEEERQRLALEERLQAQGRGGIQTAQYGGTPEQLAMAKAQAEAQNQAGLMAMQQAGSEQDRAYQQALGLSGQASQLAGMSSDLQGAQQTRAAQLAGLGMTGTEQTQAMGAERLRQLMNLQTQDIGAATAQQALQSGNLGLASGLFDYGTASAMQPGQMTQQQLQLQAAMMGAGYAPENQMLNMLAGGTQVGQLADLGRREAAQQYSEANMSGLEGMLQSRQGSAELSQQYYNALASLAGSQNQQGQGMISQLWNGQGGAGSGGGLGGFLSGLLGGGGGTDVGGLPIFNTGSLTSDSAFSNALSDYLGGGGSSNSSNSGLLGGSFNITDMFDYGGTPTADGGTFFGSGSGTNFDFGSTFDPYALSYSAGGGGMIDYGSGNPYTFPSGGG
jgi:hypothetical protein